MDGYTLTASSDIFAAARLARLAGLVGRTRQMWRRHGRGGYDQCGGRGDCGDCAKWGYRIHWRASRDQRLAAEAGPLSASRTPAFTPSMIVDRYPPETDGSCPRCWAERQQSYHRPLNSQGAVAARRPPLVGVLAAFPW
jgi:hypothetical protein